MSLKKFDQFEPKGLNEDYQNPDEFEHVDDIDVSLTSMRKALRVSIGSASVELNKEQAVEIYGAIEKAIKLMPR